LKYYAVDDTRAVQAVAVFMTAWIEIEALHAVGRYGHVAVFMTAWIEIQSLAV